MDPGYQTLTSYYMANFYRLTGDQEFFDQLIEPSVKMLQYFVHPDGSVGGEYGSRNCSLYFPGGIEYFASLLPEAEAIARTMAKGIVSGNTPHLQSQDIRNFVPMLSTYVAAMNFVAEGAERKSADPPFCRRFERYWPDAGIYVRSGEKTYTIIGIKKGGVIKVFRKSDARMIASHCGYMLQTREGRWYSTQMLSKDETESLSDCVGTEMPVVEERILTLSPRLYEVIHDRTMSQLKLLLFRLFTITFGRNATIGNWVKRHIITGRLIHRRKAMSGRMERTFRFRGEALDVHDRLQGADSAALADVRAGDIFTTIYMASAKYYRHQESIPDQLSKNDLSELVATGGVKFTITDQGLGDC